MRNFGVLILGALAAVCFTAPACAGSGVIGVSWDYIGDGWDLYANVSSDTIVLNADLGDSNIDLPPGGINTGLFSTNGEIIKSSSVALGDETVELPRMLTIVPSGTGSLADAAWFTLNGAVPEFDPETGYRVWLGRFFVESDAFLGGPFGGPDSKTQSRIYMGWVDDIGIGIGVFDIPQTVICASEIFVDANALPGGDGSSWESAFNNLHDALQKAAVCGDAVTQINVAQGIYTPAEPNGDRTQSFSLSSGVAIYGGFPTGGDAFEDRDPAIFITTLSGDLNADDDLGGDNSENSYHVLQAVGISDGANTILDGFVITAGNANSIDDPLDDDAGGLLINASSLTVTNCIFINNSASTGGAIMQLAASDTTFMNCLVVFNQAADHSGAINNSNSNLILINCNISENQALQADGIRISGETSSAIITNSILWGNGDILQDDQIMIADGALPANLNINYANIEGWTGEYGGTGNIDADPLFIDPLLNDFHIGSGSPCIDSADNAALPKAVLIDLDGNSRYIDDPCTTDTGSGAAPIIDMGAYEFQVTCLWDLDCSGNIGTGDLLELFAQWGTPGSADFDESGAVGTGDLLILFANWGSCP